MEEVQNKLKPKSSEKNGKNLKNVKLVENDIVLNVKDPKEKKIIENKIEETPENKNFDSEIFSKNTSFKELGVCDEICEILTILNYKYPTKIQEATLPYTLKSKN